MNGSPIVFGIFCKAQADYTQGQHRCGFGPCLVCLHEAGKKLFKLLGILFGCHDIIPRLFVVGRRGPARRLKQRTEVSLRHWTIFETIWTPPISERMLDGMIYHGFFYVHILYIFEGFSTSWF